MKIILSIYLMLTFSSLIAYEKAVVISPRAVIYADMKLTSPIGYISEGKSIFVGSVKRRQGKVVPIIINKKICYLKTKDIQFTKRK